MEGLQVREKRGVWLSRRCGLLAVLWSSIYLVAAIGWKLGGPYYPYGRHWDPAPIPVSLMDSVSAGTGTTVMISFAVITLGATAWLVIAHRSGVAARAVTVLVLGACLGLILVGDARPLMAVARMPAFLVTNLVWGVGEGRMGIGTFARAMFDVPAIHGFWQLAGIVVLLFALYEFWRRASNGCPDCGRPDPMPRWTSRSSARRWGMIVTIVAVACPLPYAISRYLFLFEIPHEGFTRSEIQQLDAEAPGIWIFGAALATFGVLGAVLTLGLVQRWGERWPFWVPVVRGRPINPKVAIIPAGFVSLLWPGSSLMYLRENIHRQQADKLDDGSYVIGVLSSPSTLWVLWGFALAAATLAYWLRRRPDCAGCCRGIEPMRGIWQHPMRSVRR